MIVQGLPHACGGVSIRLEDIRQGMRSSPRMWGCFFEQMDQRQANAVFPTHVGVFLLLTQRLRMQPSLPHACGGVSALFPFLNSIMTSSPRMWGCFQKLAVLVLHDGVFPTHVGVFPFPRGEFYGYERLPHACGGVSVIAGETVLAKRSSPRMWGCFFHPGGDWPRRVVFPTHVGVFPPPRCFPPGSGGLPHACGGVSLSVVSEPGLYSSSPRMWGCFHDRHRRGRSDFGLPHACGGVSAPARRRRVPLPSSPRMWGCFYAY